MTMDDLLKRFNALQPREQMLVATAGGLIGIALLYLIFFGPLATNLAKRQDRVARKEQDIVWMQSAANAVRVAAANRAGATGGESIVVVINRSAQQAGIVNSLTNQSPQGETGIRVRLEKVNFDALVMWLGLLDQQFDVHIENANIDRADKAGLVNATVSLTRGTQP
jgi:general secretion pathway protein M